jgi:type II secretion system protein C
MEKFFRSYFWLVTLTFLGSSSYLLAHTASSVVRMMLPSPVAFRLTPRAKNQINTALLKKNAAFSILNKGNLFDTKNKPVIRPLVTKKPKDDKKKDDPNKNKPANCDGKGQYKPSQLPLQLKGTTIASDPDFSVAAVYDARRRKVFVVRTHEVFYGIKICKVEKGYLKLDRGMGRLEYLELGKPPGRGGKYNARRKLYRQYRKLRNTKLDLSSIKKKGSNQYSLSRGFLTKMTKRLDIVASQAAIVPYFSKGRPAGFRLRNIKKNSMFTKMGIKSNDVVLRINGYRFTSPQKALEAYSNLLYARQLSVTVMRKGKPVRMTYSIKE